MKKSTYEATCKPQGDTRSPRLVAWQRALIDKRIKELDKG